MIQLNILMLLAAFYRFFHRKKVNTTHFIQLINFLMFEISPIINCGVTIKQQQLSVAENGEVGEKVLH